MSNEQQDNRAKADDSAIGTGPLSRTFRVEIQGLMDRVHAICEAQGIPMFTFFILDDRGADVGVETAARYHLSCTYEEFKAGIAAEKDSPEWRKSRSLETIMHFLGCIDAQEMLPDTDETQAEEVPL